MEFSRFNRYDKCVIEPFALAVIAASYDVSFAKYTKPVDTDNFDYISKNEKNALEITLVLPENISKAYEFEKERVVKGKVSANPLRVKDSIIDMDGKLKKCHGGTLGEIKKLVHRAVQRKDTKANRRKEKYERIDLCICVQDGCLLTNENYKDILNDAAGAAFARVFVITASRFLVYCNGRIREYPLKVLEPLVCID